MSTGKTENLQKRADRQGRLFFRRSAVLLLMTVLTMVLLISGCSRRAASSAGKPVIKEYTRGQVMVVTATERNRYQNVYTGRLWSVEADSEGHTFEEKLKAQIEQFLLELAVMNLMAEEKGIRLSGQETDSIKNLTQEYWDSLSEGDKAYMDAEKSEIFDLYCQYFLADKLVEELTGEKRLEVSDAEAKVIEILQICLDTREEAQEVLEQVSQEKADFASIASAKSADGQVRFSLERTEDMDRLGETAFSLEQDEISGIIEQNGRFYIQKCINAYDQEATALRKITLAQEKRTRAFREIYEPFTREHTVKLKSGLMDQVDFSGGQDCTSDSYFQMYHEHFGR